MGDIRETVKRRYGKPALDALQGSTGTCCGGGDLRRRGSRFFTANPYGTGETEALPEVRLSVEMWVGCVAGALSAAGETPPA